MQFYLTVNLSVAGVQISESLYFAIMFRRDIIENMFLGSFPGPFMWFGRNKTKNKCLAFINLFFPKL